MDLTIQNQTKCSIKKVSENTAIAPTLSVYDTWLFIVSHKVCIPQAFDKCNLIYSLTLTVTLLHTHPPLAAHLGSHAERCSVDAADSCGLYCWVKSGFAPEAWW